MDTATLTKAALGLGICLGIAKFVSNATVKAACYGVAGLIVAKQIPIVKDAI